MITENLRSLEFKFTYGGEVSVSRYTFDGGTITSNLTHATISFPSEGFDTISSRFRHTVLHGGEVWLNGYKFGKFSYTHYSQTKDEISFSIIKD